MKPNNTTLLILAMSIGLALTGCNQDAGSDQVPATHAADLDGEVYSQASWSELSPEKPESDLPTGEVTSSEDVVDNAIVPGKKDQYYCTNEQYSLTSNPKEFVAISPDESVIWLGNLIQGSSHLAVGELEGLAISDRAPMAISISFLRGDNYRWIEKPSLTTVNSAIGELIDSAMREGFSASSDAYFNYTEAHSSSEASLKLGISAEYLGNSLDAKLAVYNEGAEHTYYAYFIQKAFTVSMELPSAPHDVVTSNFTTEKLQALKDREEIGDNNPPLYISNIGYGRVMIYKMTSTHSKSDIEAAINASYYGYDVNVETRIKETLDTAKIEVATFGGDDEAVTSLIRSGKLSDYFSVDTQLSSMRPISFEVRNLRDNLKAGIVRTTEYNVKSCTYVGDAVPPVGEMIKVHFDRVSIPYDCDSGIDKGDIYGRFDVIYTDNNTGGQVTRRVVTVPVTKVQSGNTLDLNQPAKGTDGKDPGLVPRYTGKTFRISGQLKDQDGGANGADDIVGNWNANQFDISGLKPGTYTKKAVSNCSGSNPTLTYRLERVGYLYQ